MKIKRICRSMLMHSTTTALSLALILGTAGGAFGKANSQSSGGIVASATEELPTSGSGEFKFGGNSYSYHYSTDRHERETFELKSVKASNQIISIPSEVFIDGRYHTITRLAFEFGKNLCAETVKIPDTITDIASGAFRSAKIGTLYVSSEVRQIGESFCSYADLGKVVYNGDKLETLGSWSFTGDNYGLTANSHGAVLFGEWLIKYVGGGKSVKISELGEKKKITKIGPQCFSTNNKEINNQLECIDLTDVDTIGDSAFRGNPNLKTITGSNSIKAVGSYAFDNTIWYNNCKNNNVAILGSVLLYYHTNNSIIDLSDSRFNKVKLVNKNALFDCQKCTTLKLNKSIERFDNDSFRYDGTDKIDTVYVGTKKIVYDDNDQFLTKPLAKSLSLFRNSKYVKQFITDKTKGLLKSMGFTYYGKGNTYESRNLSNFQKYQIAYKLHEYIVTNYSYRDDSNDFLQPFLDGKSGFVCLQYAELYAYLLESAGVDAEVVTSSVYDENGELIYDGNHAWNIVRVGYNWYHVDVCWDSTSYNFGYKNTKQWFMVSDEYMKRAGGSHAMWALKKYGTPYFFQDTANLPKCNYLLGDADGNNYREKRDVELIQRYLLNDKSAFKKLQFGNSDVSFNSKIDMPDVVNLLIILDCRSSDPLKNYGNHTVKMQ